MDLRPLRLLSCQSRILLQKKITELEDSRLIFTHRKDFKTWISFEIRSVFKKSRKFVIFSGSSDNKEDNQNIIKKLKGHFLKTMEGLDKKFAIKTELQLSPITLSKYNDSKQANRGLGSSTTRAAFKAI